VGVEWRGLAAGAEISVRADGTLEAGTTDASVVTVVDAERAIAVDTVVQDGEEGMRPLIRRKLCRIVDDNEAMTRMLGGSLLGASITIIPVGAVKALVSKSSDRLVARIANGVVADAPARGEASNILRAQRNPVSVLSELMNGVVAVSALTEAHDAEIVVLAVAASDDRRVRESAQAAVAKTLNNG